MYLRSQLDDYRFRGHELASTNFIDYFVDTYEEHISSQANASHVGEEPGDSADQHAGRPKHVRVAYQAQHPRSATKHQVVRPKNHRNLPDIVGPWFERNDNPATYSLYCASVLACLKPWRALEDLKAGHQSWTAALHAFEAEANDGQQCIQANMQYYYQCQDKANKESEESTHLAKGGDGDPSDPFDLSEFVNGIELEKVVMSDRKRKKSNMPTMPLPLEPNVAYSVKVSISHGSSRGCLRLQLTRQRCKMSRAGQMRFKKRQQKND